MAHYESLLPYLTSVSKAKDSDDAKKIIFENAGDLSDIEVAEDKILVGVYARSERLGKLGLLIATDNRKSEDQWSGNVGLILKKGAIAFKYNKESFDWEGREPQVGDWVLFKPSHSSLYGLRKAAVRFMKASTEVIDAFGFSDPQVWD